MNRFDGFLRWAWSVLVVCTLAFALAGCEGDDGRDGAAGADGTDGVDGVDGADGTDGADFDPNSVAAAVEAAQPESCATCHDGVGEDHQALYDKYVDTSDLVMTFTNFNTVPGAVAGTFDATLEFSIAKDGAPLLLADYNALPQKRFYVGLYDSATRQYVNGGFTSLNDTIVMVADGDYVLTEAGLPFDPMVNGQVYGYIADEPLLEHESGTGAELPAGTHVHLYDNVANTALAFGDASVTDPDAYVSAANVAGCVKCHGSPYLKHGFRAAEVAGLPDFASCKVCHNDAGQGGHTEWQYMVDEPFNWATGVVETADYSYNRNIMNDVHMAHAMEFPYPQSMATCNTCHEGKLAQVLDNSEFTPETCKSCHPIQGIDAWPEYVAADGTTIEEGPYFQPHRAPAFQYLWTLAGVEGLHTPTPMVCNGCHSPGAAPTFNELHSGYDKTIYDASGVRYADAYTVSIDQITRSGDLLTVNFSSSDPAIVPELLVSFYGWDTKHFIVGSHERDGNPVCTGFRPGCKMEYVPESSGGGANPLFMEDAASVPGNWMVTLDMSALQLTKTALIPQLIADGDIKMAEITITPELNLGGTDVVLEPVDETFDLGSSMIVANYFKGTEATVDIDKCNVCHDALASSFHDGSGRGGDGIEVCKNCHTTTFPGSHLEMASRSIENYVHAIHTFQDFDVGGNNGTFGAAFDPVDAKRYDQHIKHVFPNFTIRNCEACHVEADARVFPPPDLDTTTYPVTYNVPDQSKSMPGVLSASDAVATWYELVGGLAVEDPAGRNIGTVPEVVTGPASRACGGCHRGRLIRDDAAGDLASLNAHTEAGGTFVENDDADAKLFGIIEKIMGMFE